MENTKKPYDVLIVGSGLAGATFASLCKRVLNLKCLIIEKRNHIGGNIYTEKDKESGIHIHKYGAHIFHTSDDKIWHFVNEFATFENFINSPIAKFKSEIYNLPFNMNTFAQMWPHKAMSPIAAKNIIEEEIENYNRSKAYTGRDHREENLEEHAISMVGTTIYEKLIKHYTEKQWGRPCKELSASLIKRLPLRFTFDNNYFNDKYQGIPSEGYTSMIENMVTGITVLTNTDYFSNREYWNSQAEHIVYTGPIDQFFDYLHGKLLWRTLRFEEIREDPKLTQGVAVVNHTGAKPEYTRTIEHAYFLKETRESLLNGTLKDNIISIEYPCEWTPEQEPYYPVSNDKNNDKVFEKYVSMANASNVIFLGRLGTYKYLDMDDAIQQAFDMFEQFRELVENS